jgi:hypothetical protein
MLLGMRWICISKDKTGKTGLELLFKVLERVYGIPVKILKVMNLIMEQP